MLIVQNKNGRNKRYSLENLDLLYCLDIQTKVLLDKNITNVMNSVLNAARLLEAKSDSVVESAKPSKNSIDYASVPNWDGIYCSRVK